MNSIEQNCGYPVLGQTTLMSEDRAEQEEGWTDAYALGHEDGCIDGRATCRSKCIWFTFLGTSLLWVAGLYWAVSL